MKHNLVSSTLTVEEGVRVKVKSCLDCDYRRVMTREELVVYRDDQALFYGGKWDDEERFVMRRLLLGQGDG